MFFYLLDKEKSRVHMLYKMDEQLGKQQSFPLVAKA